MARNVVRVIAWLWGEPLGACRRKPGHCAQLAPHPLSRQTVLCSGMASPTESSRAGCAALPEVCACLLPLTLHGYHSPRVLAACGIGGSGRRLAVVARWRASHCCVTCQAAVLAWIA